MRMKLNEEKCAVELCNCAIREKLAQFIDDGTRDLA